MSQGNRRILLVNLSKGWGGGELWHFNAARGLRERGWEAVLLVYPGSALAQRAVAAGLPVWPMPLRTASLANPWKTITLWWGLRRMAPGTVILNASHELKVAGLMARLAGVPRIILRRGIPTAPHGGGLNRWYLEHVVTGMIVNSHATLRAMEETFSDVLKPLSPQVIYNGLEPGEWTPPASREPGSMIAVVGRLEPEKGVDLALEALARLLPVRAAAHLIILGGGSQRQALEEQAARLGIKSAVTFTGHVDDVAARLASCDLLLLPSRWEGFGYVLVEAMLLQRPVVAFGIPAAREIVEDGVTGLLVPPGDLDGMAHALEQLLGDPFRMERMGRAGRLRAIERFSLETMLDALEAAVTEQNVG